MLRSRYCGEGQDAECKRTRVPSPQFANDHHRYEYTYEEQSRTRALHSQVKISDFGIVRELENTAVGANGAHTPTNIYIDNDIDMYYMYTQNYIRMKHLGVHEHIRGHSAVHVPGAHRWSPVLIQIGHLVRPPSSPLNALHSTTCKCRPDGLSPWPCAGHSDCPSCRVRWGSFLWRSA